MELLMNLAMGRVIESPFPREAVDLLRNRIICHLEQLGIPLERTEMLKASRDPDRGVGDFALGSGSALAQDRRCPRGPGTWWSSLEHRGRGEAFVSGLVDCLVGSQQEREERRDTHCTRTS